MFLVCIGCTKLSISHEHDEAGVFGLDGGLGQLELFFLSIQHNSFIRVMFLSTPHLFFETLGMVAFLPNQVKLGFLIVNYGKI